MKFLLHKRTTIALVAVPCGVIVVIAILWNVGGGTDEMPLDSRGPRPEVAPGIEGMGSSDAVASNVHESNSTVSAMTTELSNLSVTEFGREQGRIAREALEKMTRPDLRNGPTARERTAAHHRRLQIPEEELASMSTAQLVDKVAGSSFAMVLAIDPQASDGGLSHFSKHYNGVDALLEREDVVDALLIEYDRMSQGIRHRPVGDSREILKENGAFAIRFMVMETLLSSPRVIDTITDDTARTIMTRILQALDARRQHDASLPTPLYGEGMLEWTALPIAKCLDKLSVPEYKEYLESKSTTGLFVSRPLTYDEAREIIAMGKQHLASQ